MVEWFIAPVLKTGDPQGSVGSNPTPSAILLRLALDFTRRVSSNAPLASDRPAMVRFGSVRGYWPAFCAAQIFDLSADGVSHLAPGSLPDCGVGPSVAVRRADADPLGTADHSRLPWSVCPPFVA